MQVSLENIANLERRLTVSLPAERLDGVVDNRLREIARTANLKGFRPGKVPAKVIEQRFGAQVRAEAFGELVRETFDEAVRQENLQPATNPDIRREAEEAKGEIRYTATFEVVPDFGTIDVSKLTFERAHAVVEESDVDTMIDTLRQQRRTWNPVDRPAQIGDFVRVDTHAETAVQRIPADGVEQGATVLGSNVLYPEIETQLVGMSAGEEKTIETNFPGDWRVPALAGHTARVTVKVVQVSEPVVPEVDEAFIRSFGIKSGKPEQFRKEVRANLERELKGTLMNRLRGEVASKLVEAHAHVELPPRMVEGEARALANAITADTKTPVIVDNRPGANAFIGAQLVAKAKPDGYTVLIATNTTHAANEHLYKKLPYDPVKDFEPITALGRGGQLMVVRRAPLWAKGP